MIKLQNIILNLFKSSFSIGYRDILLKLRNLTDVISLLAFFIISVLIFIFSIGPNEEQLRIVGISIIWSILILSSSITVNKLIKDDFDDGNFALYQFTNLSYELIVIIKIFTSWIIYQLPLIILTPIICVALNISSEKIYLLIIIMLIGSPTITIISLIASAMMLTNKKNLTLGSLVILPMSVPIIIFAVGAVNSDVEFFIPQLYILLSFLLVALALGPWVISACIKIALKN